MPDLMLQILLHLVHGRLHRTVAFRVAGQLRESACGSLHLSLIRTGFEESVHQRILKPPVQLREVWFCQAGCQHGEAGAVMHEQHTVSALDGEQVGVPAAQRALGSIISGLWER